MRSWSPVISFGFSVLKILQFQEGKKALFLFGEGHSRCLCNPGGEDFSPDGGPTSKETFMPNVSECSVYVGIRTTE